MPSPLHAGLNSRLAEPMWRAHVTLHHVQDGWTFVPDVAVLQDPGRGAPPHLGRFTSMLRYPAQLPGDGLHAGHSAPTALAKRRLLMRLPMARLDGQHVVACLLTHVALTLGRQ